MITRHKWRRATNPHPVKPKLAPKATSYRIKLQRCGRHTWYEGFQASARQQCAALRSPSAIQQCMDQVNSLSYPQYQREREGIPDEEAH